MPPVHGRNTGVIVNEHDLSRFFKSVEISGEAELVDTTTFTAPAKTYIPGYRDGKASLDGLFGSKDPAQVNDPKEVDDVLQPILGDDANTQLVLIAQEGLDAIGKTASIFQAKSSKYSVKAPYNGVVSVMSELQADGGINVGVLLAHKAIRTATGSGAAYDLGAATTGGLVAQLHLFAISGAGANITVTIEDSADGATGWALIGSFTGASAAVARRIAAIGNVRRYVRAVWTITGTTPSTTFAVGFALQR